MTDGRERDVIRAFLDLSQELVDDYDVIDMLAQLTSNVAHLLDVSAVCLLLPDGRGVLHLVASSSDDGFHLEMFQLQRDEGPCLDCYREQTVVAVPDLLSVVDRWPRFRQVAREAGVRSVHALPMRLRDDVLGAVGLFNDHVRVLPADDVALAQGLVHVASVAIVNARSADDRASVNAQLQHALTSRVTVEQAKGVIAYAGRLEMSAAFAVLRRYARDHGRKLSDVALEVVRREVAPETLLQHAEAAAILP